MSQRSLWLTVLAVPVLLVSCSSGPSPSGFQHFADAKNNLKASDFKAALSNLEITIKTSPDPAEKREASMIRVLLIAAMADADAQMAAAYQVGAREAAAQGQTGTFYKMRADYGNTSRTYLMDAMQTVMDQRDQLDASAPPVPIGVPFPGFTGGLDETQRIIKSGRLVSDGDRLSSEMQLTRNAFAKLLTALAGAGQDLNRGRDLYGAGKVNVDARTYIVEMSDAFLQIGQIFDVRAMNEPDKWKLVNQVVEQNLVIASKLLAAKPDKDLEARVKKMQADCDRCLKKLGA